MSSLLLLEDLIKRISPPAPRRLALFAAVLLCRAPPSRGLDARPATVADQAGGREDERALDGVRRDAEGAGGHGVGHGGRRVAPQLAEARALLQGPSSCSSSGGPGALTLEGVEPGREEEGLGGVLAS